MYSSLIQADEGYLFEENPVCQAMLSGSWLDRDINKREV